MITATSSAGEQMSMLLTGDARGDKIIDGLELVGLLRKKGKLHVNILKVPHHGSARNMEQGFFERVTADHYVFSGDGNHGNPDRQTVQMLLDARPDDKFTMHFTYSIAELDKGREADWKKEQGKERKRKEKKPRQEVRPNWSAKNNSLAALLKARGKPKQKVVIAGNPHLIQLLDPI
jgi:hypothetical protein